MILFSKYSNLCEKHTYLNVKDGRTDRRTDDKQSHNRALCVASRGKNEESKEAMRVLRRLTEAPYDSRRRTNAAPLCSSLMREGSISGVRPYTSVALTDSPSFSTNSVTCTCAGTRYRGSGCSSSKSTFMQSSKNPNQCAVLSASFVLVVALVERWTRDRKVTGSTPGPGAIKSTRSTQPSIPPG